MNTQRFFELSLMSLFVFSADGCARAASIPASAPAATSDDGTETQEVMAPVAEPRPHKLETHGHVRVDEYYWLREREDSQVIAYLEAENAHTEAMTAHTKALEEQLFDEIRSRIDETDESVPYRLRDHFYYTRTVEGKDYPIYARKRGSLDAPEEVMLDANVLAEGKSFFAIQGMRVSEGQDILAFAVDTVGRRIATIRFKNLSTGEMLEDVIPNVTGNMAWAADNRTLFYSRQDPNTLRSYRIYRHVLGTDPAQDEIVFEETDEEYRTYVFRTKSREYVVIGSSQTLSDEYRYLKAADPRGEFRVFLPRQRDHEHSIDHFGDYFYVRTNSVPRPASPRRREESGGASHTSGASETPDGSDAAGPAKAQNFRLVRTPVDRTAPEHWEAVIPHRDDVLLQGFEIFRDHLVISERQDGLTQLRVRPWSGEDEHYIEFDEPAYLASIGNNPEIDTNTLRFGYTSLTTPSSVYDYDMRSHERTLRKRDRVLGGYEPADYRTERLYAQARDGARVPISLVYRRELRRDGPQPLLLYGYGSYGATIDPSFSSLRLSLLDRGFAFAIAHIRGGQTMGRQWYESGKLLEKKNTFTDFIDVAEHLVAEGYASPDRLYAQGGSAGGLLIGAVINMRPDLFHGVIADVPFVDVVTTMLDETIPLTTFEYDEWGNPNERTYYDYMLSYSPYDNVKAQPYPHLLVTAGLHDSQVQYWEPAKWVARLRAHKTDDNRLLLKTNMEAGHGGASGRYRRWHEIAFEYAFLLDLAGLAGAAQ